MNSYAIYRNIRPVTTGNPSAPWKDCPAGGKSPAAGQRPWIPARRRRARPPAVGAQAAAGVRRAATPAQAREICPEPGHPVPGWRARQAGTRRHRGRPAGSDSPPLGFGRHARSGTVRVTRHRPRARTDSDPQSRGGRCLRGSTDAGQEAAWQAGPRRRSTEARTASHRRGSRADSEAHVVRTIGNGPQRAGVMRSRNGAQPFQTRTGQKVGNYFRQRNEWKTNGRSCCSQVKGVMLTFVCNYIISNHSPSSKCTNFLYLSFSERINTSLSFLKRIMYFQRN